MASLKVLEVDEVQSDEDTSSISEIEEKDTKEAYEIIENKVDDIKEEISGESTEFIEKLVSEEEDDNNDKEKKVRLIFFKTIKINVPNYELTIYQFQFKANVSANKKFGTIYYLCDCMHVHTDHIYQ